MRYEMATSFVRNLGWTGRFPISGPDLSRVLPLRLINDLGELPRTWMGGGLFSPSSYTCSLPPNLGLSFSWRWVTLSHTQQLPDLPIIDPSERWPISMIDDRSRLGFFLILPILDADIKVSILPSPRQIESNARARMARRYWGAAMAPRYIVKTTQRPKTRSERRCPSEGGTKII